MMYLIVVMFPVVQIVLNSIYYMFLLYITQTSHEKTINNIAYIVYPLILLVYLFFVLFYNVHYIAYFYLFLLKFTMVKFLMSILFGVYLGIFTYKIENYFFKYEKKVNIRNIKNLLWTKLFTLVIIISICEELLFRLVSFDIFSDIFNNNLIIIVVTAIIFGLNHIIFGIKQVFIKLFIGLLWGFAYLNTLDVVLVIVAHIIYNLFIFAYKKQNE